MTSAVLGPVEHPVLTPHDGIADLALDVIMPTPGLCRVGHLSLCMPLILERRAA
jgi:hypothetical protein